MPCRLCGQACKWCGRLCCCLWLCRYDEAEKDLLRAASLLQHTVGSHHPYVGEILVALGEMAAARSDHLEATSLFSQVRSPCTHTGCVLVNGWVGACVHAVVRVLC